MNKWKRATFAAAVLTAVGSVLAVAPVANATTSPSVIELSDADLAYFYSVADRFGVPEDLQESLLAKVKAGVPLDSSTGVAPVSTVMQEVDGFTRTVETFADGSVIGSDIEIPRVEPEDGVSARGIAGCTTGSSAGVFYGQDCWVYTSSLTMGASFYTSYSRWSTGSSVWNWHTPSINVIGTVTNVKWVPVSGTNSKITLKWNSQSGGLATLTTWLTFNASPTGISQTRGGSW